MRVLFNGASTIRPKTGVGHTTNNLHQALRTVAPNDEFWLYPGPLLRKLATRYLKPKSVPSGSQTPPKPATKNLIRELALRGSRLAYAAHFHSVVRLNSFDLYHEPNLVPFQVPLPTVVTIHDLSVILFPDWHPAERVKRYQVAFDRGVATAAHIIVDSETVRGEVIRHLGLQPSRVTTVPIGISSNFTVRPQAEVDQTRQRFNLPDRYLLCVGTIEPRKNLLTLLKAYCDLPTACRAVCPLALAGTWGWKSAPERDFFERVGRERGVRYLGYVADEDLPPLYTGATALLYPSFYEGFGLPPVEAMACGTAAIVSTADAVSEVVGNHALQIHPDDLAGWRNAMHRAITDRDSLERYRREGMGHAAQYGWDRAARVTLEVYHRVLGLPEPLISTAVSSRAAA